MVAAGFTYVNNWTWLSAENMDRDTNSLCAGRAVPGYFATPKQSSAVNTPAGCTGASPGKGCECVRSVAYDWGGWHTINDYQRLLGKGSQAGDVDIAAIESCSVGVDCSGLIGRLWRTPDFTRVDGTTTSKRPRRARSMIGAARSARRSVTPSARAAPTSSR